MGQPPLLINWIPVHKHTLCYDCMPGKELCEEAEQMVLVLDSALDALRRRELS